MLSRTHRLVTDKDITATLRRGSVINVPPVRIHVLRRSNDQTPSRVACVVSKKVHLSSVKRHRYQRWLRAAATKVLPRLNHSYDMVWIATPAITSFKNSTTLYTAIKPHLASITQP